MGSNLLGGSWGDFEVPFSIWKGKFKRPWVLPYKRVSHLSLVTVTESGVCAICNRQICWSFLSFFFFFPFLCWASILWIWSFQFWRVGLLQWLSSKESACNAGDTGSIPGSGISPGEGNGTLLQYSFLGNPMDRGAWRATVLLVAKGQIRLNTQNCIYRGNTTLPSTTFCRLYSHLAPF